MNKALSIIRLEKVRKKGLFEKEKSYQLIVCSVLEQKYIWTGSN
jgi:hypothetical protein